jgi:hypothetical protein
MVGSGFHPGKTGLISPKADVARSTTAYEQTPDRAKLEDLHMNDTLPQSIITVDGTEKWASICMDFIGVCMGSAGADINPGGPVAVLRSDSIGQTMKLWALHLLSHSCKAGVTLCGGLTSSSS